MSILFRVIFISMFSFAYSDCVDLDQTACEASTECEWHADDTVPACEDAEGDGHDHGDEDCDEITDQAECVADTHCEWHVEDDGSAGCEDAEGDGHDHGDEDCDEITDQAECVADTHCEWHVEDDGSAGCEDAEGDGHMVMKIVMKLQIKQNVLLMKWHVEDDGSAGCEDAEGDGHDHGDEDCDEITDQAECVADTHCEWHVEDDGSAGCEDAEGDGHDHAHCDDLTIETECDSTEGCDWHVHDGVGECEDASSDNCAGTDHFSTQGLELEHDESEIYSQLQGLIEGSVEVEVNSSKDLSVHFLDASGNEIEINESTIACYPLSFNVTDPSVISVVMEDDHDGHDHGDDDHGDDDHGDDDHEDHLVFELTGLSVGSTTFTISIMHQGHADFTSMPILVTCN